MADTTKSAEADNNLAFGDIPSPRDASAEEEEGEEDAEDPEAVLASFREQWQRELQAATTQKAGGAQTPTQPPPPLRDSPGLAQNPGRGIARVDILPPPKEQEEGGSEGRGGRVEDGSTFTRDDHSAPPGGQEEEADVVVKATELFNQAVELERSRRLYEAIQFYRRAMTLVPDIEFRVHRQSLPDRTEGYRGVEGGEPGGGEDELGEEELEDLVMHFQVLLASSPALCAPHLDQEAAHISCLPPEMLERIMHWVVGSDLDMRSLEQVSRVCHGFYLLARNPEIWHKACLRVWGVGCGVPGAYGSWREMFLQRPHPRYNGCYISRTTYFRPGDRSFQDQNYHPWHVVQYYRYIRFFADGVVSMLTTADEPSSVVGQLRNRETKNSQVLQGQYCIHGSNVTLVLKRRARERLSNRRKGRRYIGGTTDVAETTFQIELEICPLKSRPHWLLVWRNYSIISVYYDSKQNTSQIDVNDTSKFPPLAFSRVKSYTSACVTPLV